MPSGPTAGEESMRSPVEKNHFCDPVTLSSPYTFPSSEPKYRRPLEPNAGDDQIELPVGNDHFYFPVAVSIA